MYYYDIDDDYYDSDEYDPRPSHRSNARKSPGRRQYEDTGSQIFRKCILKWRIEDIPIPCYQELHLLPKALGYNDTGRYYQNFLPLILEETRAILAQGLEAEGKNKTKPFGVRVISLTSVGSNMNNPANLELEGMLPKNTDEGSACVVLKLTYQGADNRRTSILCLEDIRERNKLSTKIIYVNHSEDAYDNFISDFVQKNPNAFKKDSQWTACVLGSVLSQMRMYEACYAPEPHFIGEVISGRLPSPLQKTVRIFPEWNDTQQRAVQDFSGLSLAHQQAIIAFSSLDLSRQTLVLNFFSLNASDRQRVQSFLLLNILEKAFVRDFSVLNFSLQQALKDFSGLNSSKRQLIQVFSAFDGSEREAVNTFNGLPDLNQEAIRWFLSLIPSEQEAVKVFFLLPPSKKEAIYAFYRLDMLEQEVVRVFYESKSSLQKVIQNSASLFSSTWKFFTGKSWYEGEIKRLELLCADLEGQFSSNQHRAVECFYALNSIEQASVRTYFSLPLSIQTVIFTFFELDLSAQEAVQFFYALNVAEQRSVQTFQVLPSSEKADVIAFYRLEPLVQKALQSFYALNASEQEAVQPFALLDYEKQESVKPFYGSTANRLDAVRTFSSSSVSTKKQIRYFSVLEASNQAAIRYFFAFTASEKTLYEAFRTLNYSQQVAVRDFYVLKKGIQILQGPPGTGKTTTIVELLNFLCAQKKRVLVCAPSNKAVQVIAERFVEKHPIRRTSLAGVEKKLKEVLRPVFVHTWADDMCFTLDTFTEKLERTIQNRSAKKNNPINLEDLFQQIQQMINAICHATALFRESCFLLQSLIQAMSFRTPQLEKILEQLSILREEIYDSIAYDPKQFGSKIELALLNDAEVIFATLSTSGRRIFSNIKRVDVLIIDEASQAVEVETLIPFGLRPDKCLLVGDTKQLPATVISQEAVRYNYHWSMMWRLIEECGQRCGMLTIQHRMHPSIRQWPSLQYYGNQLVDAPEIANRSVSVSVYGSYAFINVLSEEHFSNYSCYNAVECEQVMLLLHELVTKHVNIETQVGIITFYAAQVEYMQREFSKTHWLKGVKVHTVDSYQGNENNYIIISFVRSNRGGGIGFLHDFRRLNVAITRARLALLMVGNAATLERHGQQDVAQLVRDARSRHCLFGEVSSKEAAVPKKQTGSSARFFKAKPERAEESGKGKSPQPQKPPESKKEKKKKKWKKDPPSTKQTKPPGSPQPR